MQFRRIVIGLSNTDTDRGLLQYANLVVRLVESREIWFAHVLPETPEPSSHAPPESPDAARDRLEQLVAASFPAGDGPLERHLHVVTGPRLDRLLAFAAERQADLILVGHRRSRSGRRSLARRLAMKAPCSAWMAPEDAPAEIRRILIPVDFSQQADDALRGGVKLAQAAGVPCIALHVCVPDASLVHENLRAGDRARAQDVLARMVASVSPDGKVAQLIETGSDVARTILDVAAARDANLIVMGTRGRSPSAAILLGSVTEQVMMESRLPVLTVTRPGSRLGVLQALLSANH